MIYRIPTIEGKLSQKNNSDRTGNLWYTKNITLDKPGTIRLSRRSVALIDSGDDNDFNIPVSFGRESNNAFKIVTVENAFDLDLSPSQYDISQDADSGSPTLSFDSLGRWWQNRWYATLAAGLRYKTGSTWTTVSLSPALTSGVMHALEVFRNKNTMCISNGNEVKQIDTSHADTVNLVLPTDYEITKMSYSNQRMGIITRLSESAQWQNQEAFFFYWDGGTAQANAGYPMGTDFLIDIVPYKSYWAILTRDGRLLYFNGGGFELLGALPFYFSSNISGDPVNATMYGDIMTVEGDNILINLQNVLNNYGLRQESVMQEAPSGVWCFDPAVGLYHRYSPSISKASMLKVALADVNTTTNILTKTTGTIPSTGSPVKYVYNLSAAIGGLQVGKIYYIIKLSSTTFKLALTKEDAINLNAIDITSQGDTFNYFFAIELYDYGQTYTNRQGGIGIIGAKGFLADHLVFGGELYRRDSHGNDYEFLCMTIENLKSIGFFVTPRLSSDEVTNIIKKVFIKHAPLQDGDEIILKYKLRNYRDIPVTVPQSLAPSGCAWASSTSFTTIADLSAAKTLFDAGEALECEIIAGAGGGQMSQISDIEYSGGTYTVTLDDEIEGATSGHYCDIIIDNWKVAKTDRDESSITSTNTKGYAEFPIGKPSQWVKFKVELRGKDVEIEDFQVVADNQLKAQ